MLQPMHWHTGLTTTTIAAAMKCGSTAQVNPNESM